jgi:rhomboid domain-containing protein 1
MNMMSTLALSTLLEKQMGTLRHLLSILWAILMTNVVYILVSYLLSTLFAYDDLMFQHAVGFSGVLFHLLVLESNLLGQQESYRSVFGVINVPSWSYPWVL